MSGMVTLIIISVITLGSAAALYTLLQSLGISEPVKIAVSTPGDGSMSKLAIRLLQGMDSIKVGCEFELTDEADAREGVYAFEYTGPHKDSMDTSKSTEKIYYYQLNNSNRTGFLDKINVLFANHCWQMIRTTDTGGVKLLYNGEPEDGKCLSTRGNHPGYTGGNTSLNSTYWYGTNYTYDSSTGKFKISGTTEQLEPTVENLSKLEKKYTCMLTTEEGTCSTIYVVKIVDNKAYGYPINSNSHYSVYGNTAFGGGISTIGYMYGNNYKNSNLNISNSLSFTKLNGMIENASLDTTYWFADSIDYNNTSRKYNLVDPYQVSTPSDFSDLVGKYTFLNSNENNTGNNVYYIVAVNETTVYYKIIANGNLLSYYDPMVFGEDVTENPDGTFTLTDTTSVSLIDYYTDYENYKEKYTCGGSASSCSNPGYITSITLKNYNYIDIGIKMMIGKEREGSNLVDTLLARRDLLVKNSEDYSDYKYTCGTESNVCSGGDIRLILSYSDTGYTYIKNYYYGNDVYWDGEKYTLVDIVGMENYNNMDALATHHYVCQRAVTTTCNEVYYILSTMASDRQESSIVLTGGVNIAQALQNAYTNNINDSNIKFGVDAWYKNYMLSYDNYIEDTIFCNDRKIREIGPFNSNGGRINSSLVFNSYQSNSNTYNRNLDCAYITDQFSVSNPSAQLTYKVGLMTLPEQYWFSVRSNSGPNTQNWLMTPGLVSDGTKTFGTTVGASSVSFLFNANGVRPVISLIPGIEYYDGDGSMESPYLIDVG